MSTADAASTRIANACLTAGRARMVSNQRLRWGNCASSCPMRSASHARHIGDRVAAGEKFTGGHARVHDAEQPIDLVGIAFDRIGDHLRRVAPEVIGLARHRPETAHLPEQPLVDGDTRALIARVEAAGLAAEILQDGARFKHRDRPAARPGGIDDRRYSIVRRDRQELRGELLAL